MKKAMYYVGADNDTHALEVDKITGIVAASFDGFTAFEVVGYWKGMRERTLKIEVVTEKADSELVKIARELRIALNQESVMLEIVESNVAFVQ